MNLLYKNINFSNAYQFIWKEYNYAKKLYLKNKYSIKLVWKNNIFSIEDQAYS